MGRHGGRRGQGGQEDQFGETMTSQDRDFKPSFGGGRGSGGGDAGSRAKHNVQFVRQVPKFLQAHAHLLGRGVESTAGDAEEGTMDPRLALKREEEDEYGAAEDVEAEREEALAQAVAANPELVLQHPELADVAIKVKANELKEKGNKAFSEGNFAQATRFFKECVDLCPKDAIFWSNLSAAQASSSDWVEAARSAQRAIDLDPKWPKARARLAAAYTGQEDHVRAAEEYERALRLEPSNEQLQLALTKAKVAAARQEAEGKHRFKRRAATANNDRPERTDKTKQQRGGLSFGDDEEDDVNQG